MTNPNTGKPRVHPVSAVMVLLLDNLFFGANALTGGAATPLVCATVFMVTSVGVFTTQKVLAKDRFSSSLAKAMVLGAIAAIPTPISGTIVGASLLAMAGLRSGQNKQTP